jgi:hypothetical protein
MNVIPAIIMALLLGTWIFWPDPALRAERTKTRYDYLAERKTVIYDNLRDLNFEYLAGKYPEQDYEEQRGLLEDEAAGVVAEMDSETEAASLPARTASANRRRSRR